MKAECRRLEAAFEASQSYEDFDAVKLSGLCRLQIRNSSKNKTNPQQRKTKMPRVGNKKFAYTAKGKKTAAKHAKKIGAKMTKNKMPRKKGY